VFDLDDTLYSERRFVLSGFAAVAVAVEQLGPPRRHVFCALVRALREGRRQEAFQAVCQAYGLSEEHVAHWVAIVRGHRPSLRLPRESRRVLNSLASDWATGVVTNGNPAVQARKVEALGLASLVDAVVFASEHGSGRGKPDPEPFMACLTRLGVVPMRSVFVGNDPEIDVAGARAVGMWTVRVARRNERVPRVPRESDADLVVSDLASVPGALSRLVGPTPGIARALASLPGLA
jgi:putative hydrolase of the HAD superfamily